MGFRAWIFQAPRVGLEPTTLRLTAASTYGGSGIGRGFKPFDVLLGALGFAQIGTKSGTKFLTQRGANLVNVGNRPAMRLGYLLPEYPIEIGTSMFRTCNVAS
ncbi:MAG: hypothetical protein LC808_10190 [Actinobacteria bacterium]|nr:hypothetical protein [Actinomycetota bacterium]